jgi:geranylgeranyl diphosphate synthase type II
LNSEHNKHFSELLNRERKKIDKILFDSFDNRNPDTLYLPAAYILKSGGKRLRPLLVIFSARAVNNQFKKGYYAAAAVELLHNFTLVHDDIMDNAEKRRGLLTLHKKYDINTAILVGDSLLAVAYETLLMDCSGDSKKIVSSFTKSLVEVCEGQSLDKEFEMRDNVSVDEYLMMIRKKTSALFEMCCKLGAILGGGNANQVKALSTFGRNLGMAFQIQDDLLDILGPEEEFGKISGGDLIEGKKTFLFLSALSLAKGEDEQALLYVIKHKGIRKNQVYKYRNLYARLGIFDLAAVETQGYFTKAQHSLRRLPDERNKFVLEWIAHSLIKRKK